MKKEDEESLILFMQATAKALKNIGICAGLTFWIAIIALILAIIK